MRLYTSYFGQIKKILKKDPKARLISISRQTPQWFTGECFTELAPDWELIRLAKSGCSKEEFESQFYRDNLVPLTPNLEDLLVGKLRNSESGVYLLCYEKPEDFCHRHIVRDFLNKQGVKCEEWTPC